MPVDRVARAAVAEALAGFLRGDLSADQLLERLEPLNGTVGDAFLTELLRSLISYPQSYCSGISAVNWEWLVHHLAFLKTDREPPPWPHPDHDHVSFSARGRRVARLHLLALVIALALWPWLGWWPLAVCWVVSFVLLRGGFKLRGDSGEACSTCEATRRGLDTGAWVFEPFSGEADWLAHRHLAEAFDLPEYDPHTHNPPLPPLGFSGWVGVVLLLPVVGLFLLCFGLVVVGAIAFLLATWPLSLAFSSLRPVEKCRPTKTEQ